MDMPRGLGRCQLARRVAIVASLQQTFLIGRTRTETGRIRRHAWMGRNGYELRSASVRRLRGRRPKASAMIRKLARAEQRGEEAREVPPPSGVERMMPPWYLGLLRT